MLKMLKAVLVHRNGQETTIRTYAQDTTDPEEAFSLFLASGMTIKSCEWIDTLTEQRKKWNTEHPDNPIPLDA